MEKGFHQLVQNPTHERGGLIDHVYVNEPLRSMNVTVHRDCAFYSDHDIVTIYIPK